MIKKMKLNRPIIARLLIGTLILFMSCMDPIEEPPEQYSEYSDIILYNPNDGVPNGSFENDLETWRGGQWGNRAEFDIVDEENGHVLDGSKALALTTQNGQAWVWNYFDYSAGDTVVFSVNYLIPTPITSSGPGGESAFEMNFWYQGRDENNVIVNNGFKSDVFKPNATNPDSILLDDGQWHNIDVSVVYNSSDVDRVGIFVGFTDYSWILGIDRYVTVYVDQCEIQNKKCLNPSPSEFRILQPSDGDVFNLDTIKYFQTIPYEWEESIDSDTLLYTNRLVAKIFTENLPISSGFEEVDNVEHFDTDINQWESYNMPAGYRFNWFQSNSDITGLEAKYPDPDSLTVWVSDSAARSGNRSLRMGAIERDAPQHYTSLGLQLSRVNQFWSKDRLAPGSLLKVYGYMMTPSDDKISGENSVTIQLYSYGEDWINELSPEINASFSSDEWHPFSTEMIVPEQINWPGTVWAGIIFRYHQVEGAMGTVYIDDVTMSVSEPIRFFVTYYYDRLTDVESTVMSAAYLNGLFDFIRLDLNGISFTEVKLEWGILATDFITETYASNSPITITIISENQENLPSVMPIINQEQLVPDFLR